MRMVRLFAAECRLQEVLLALGFSLALCHLREVGKIAHLFVEWLVCSGKQLEVTA